MPSIGKNQKCCKSKLTQLTKCPPLTQLPIVISYCRNVSVGDGDGCKNGVAFYRRWRAIADTACRGQGAGGQNPKLYSDVKRPTETSYGQVMGKSSANAATSLSRRDQIGHLNYTQQRERRRATW